VIFLAGVFLGVLDIIALPAMANCLFRSHLLDTVGDVAAAESASVFLSGRTHICNRSCITLVRCNHTCAWIDATEKLIIKQRI